MAGNDWQCREIREAKLILNTGGLGLAFLLP
jgi:hypothetical protein